MARLRRFLVSCVALAALVSAGDLASAQTNTAPAQSARASDWKWPAIPGCLADPGIKTPGALDANSPICPVYEQLLKSGVKKIRLMSARRLNAGMDGVWYPAFLPGTQAVRFVVAGSFNRSFRGPAGLVRVSSTAVKARNGSWWTTLATISESGSLLSADAIRGKLALTYTPSCIAYAETVQTGVRAYMGMVSPAFDQPGGGIEFWFPPNAVIATSTGVVPGGTGCEPQ